MAARSFTHNPYTVVTATATAKPIETHSGCASWRLVLDGDVHSGIASSTLMRTPMARSVEAALLRERPQESQRTSEQQHQQQPHQQSQRDSPLLAPWEAKAVQVYRGIRSYRQKVAKKAAAPETKNNTQFIPPQANAQQRREEQQEVSAESDIPLSLLPLFVSAFPSPFQNTTRPATSLLHDPAEVGNSRIPRALVLEYFLLIGYPVQVIELRHASAATGNNNDNRDTEERYAQAYTKLLVDAAERMSDWFCAARIKAGIRPGQPAAVTFHINKDPTTAAAPVKYPVLRPAAFVHLPDVVCQMVAAHRMAPRTAATWVVRAFVAMMHEENSRLAKERHFLYGEPRSAMPAWPLTPASMENIRFYAEAMRNAVYKLQGGVLPVVHLDERQTQQTIDAGDTFSEWNEAFIMAGATAAGVAAEMWPTVETPQNKGEWAYLHFLVLQEALSLLLRGCVGGSSSSGDGEEATSSDTLASRWRRSPVHLPPAVSTADVVLEGLMQLAYQIRVQYDFYTPSRQYYRTDAAGKGTFFTPTYENGSMQPCQYMASEQRVLHAMEKRWVAFTAHVTRQLNHFSYTYYRFVPLISFVLTID